MNDNENTQQPHSPCQCAGMQLRAMCLDFALRLGAHNHHSDVVTSAKAFEEFVLGSSAKQEGGAA